jgi:hypothetical protein
LEKNGTGKLPLACSPGPKVELQVAPLRCPGFPVQIGGGGETVMQEIRFRFGRNNKFKGGGSPWHLWTWMDRV